MLDRIFKVLLVSSSEIFSSGIIKALASKSYDLVISNKIEKAKLMLFENEYDIVIVNAPVIDDFGIDFAIDTAIKYGCGVLMFVKSELEIEVYYKTYQYGILTLTKPTSIEVFLQSLRLIQSTIIKKENDYIKPKGLAERLEEIKLINTAKMLLISHKKLSEDEAHKYLEKRAMNLRKSKVVIAKEIIDEYYK
jgi:response regulator NasT